MFSASEAARAAGISFARLVGWRRAGLVVPSRTLGGSAAAYSPTEVVALAVLQILRCQHSMQTLRGAWPGVLRELRRVPLDDAQDVVLVVHADGASIVAAGDRQLRNTGPILGTVDLG